jgi:hypothetical protein
MGVKQGAGLVLYVSARHALKGGRASFLSVIPEKRWLSLIFSLILRIKNADLRKSSLSILDPTSVT